MLRAELTEKIIGVDYDVFNKLGHGFLENVYRNAMQIALIQAGLLVMKTRKSACISANPRSGVP